jgi:hypothetical protein
VAESIGSGSCSSSTARCRRCMLAISKDIGVHLHERACVSKGGATNRHQEDGIGTVSSELETSVNWFIIETSARLPLMQSRIRNTFVDTMPRKHRLVAAIGLHSTRSCEVRVQNGANRVTYANHCPPDGGCNGVCMCMLSAFVSSLTVATGSTSRRHCDLATFVAYS